MPPTPQPQSPLDAFPWPAQLDAHVVDAGPPPAIHGYDVEADLACHYGLLDVMLLALGGELPTDAARASVEVALIFAAPAAVYRSPAHASVIAALVGASHSALLGIAALALADEARARVSELAPLVEWLARPSPDLPACARALDERDRQAVQAMREALACRGVTHELLAQDLGREAAVLAVLWLGGLRGAHQLEAALVIARLPAVLAEAHRTKPLSFRRYPMNLPPFDYQGGP